MEILELNESDKLPIQRHTLTNIEAYAKRVSLKSLAATFESLSYLLVLIRACYILQAEALLIRLAVNYYLYFFDLVKESALFNFHGGQSGHYAQVSLTYPLKHRGSSSQRRGHAENQLNASLCPHPPMHCLVLVADCRVLCLQMQSHTAEPCVNV